MMIRAEAADRAGRNADDAGGFAAPGAFAIRTRSDVDRILEHARHTAIVFRRNEQHGVKRLDFLLEIAYDLWRVGLVVGVVKRQLSDLDDLQLERRLRHRDKRVGHLSIKGFLAQTADDDGDVAGSGHVRSSVRYDGDGSSIIDFAVW